MDCGGGAPTEWALQMRKWMIVLWVLLLGLLIAKCVVLDFFGAFGMLVVVVLGYVVPFGKPVMQQRWIIFFGLLCAFNCVVDLIFAGMHLMQYLNGTYHNSLGGYSHGGHHGGQAGYGQQGGMAEGGMPRGPTPIEKYMIQVALAAVIIGFCVPFVEFIAAWLSYKLYKDHPREEESSLGGGGMYGGQSYGGASNGGGGAYLQPRPQERQASFQAFGGSGNRLGS